MHATLIDLSKEKRYSEPHDGTAGFSYQILSNEMIDWLKCLSGQTIPLKQVADSLQFMTHGCIEITEECVFLWLVDGVPDLCKRVQNRFYQAVGERICNFFPNQTVRCVKLLRHSDP